MTAFDVYLIGTMDDIKFSLVLAGVVLAFAAIASIPHAVEAKCTKWSIIAIAVASALFLTAVCLPSSKTAASMVVLPNLEKPETAHGVPEGAAAESKDWLRKKIRGF